MFFSVLSQSVRQCRRFYFLRPLNQGLPFYQPRTSANSAALRQLPSDPLKSPFLLFRSLYVLRATESNAFSSFFSYSCFAIELCTILVLSIIFIWLLIVIQCTRLCTAVAVCHSKIGTNKLLIHRFRIFSRLAVARDSFWSFGPDLLNPVLG